MPDHIEHSLLNPNQIRANGVRVDDNPFDLNRALGIYDEDSGIMIPLTFRSAVVGLTTRTPTQDELMNVERRILLT